MKFQTFRAEEVATEFATLAEYQRKPENSGENQLRLLKALELSESAYPRLQEECARRSIIFLSTPHGGITSTRFLKRHALPAYKIGSGDLTNIPLLEEVASYALPMIPGTGMATLAEFRPLRIVKPTARTVHVFI